MTDTKEKIREMMQQESVAQRREELSYLSTASEDKKHKDIPKDVTKKTIIYRLISITILLSCALALFYGAVISNENSEAAYQLKVQEQAEQELNLLAKKSNQILIEKINTFNNILSSQEAINNFTDPSLQEIILSDLYSRLGKDAVIKIINADFIDDDIIDDADMGYSILFMLNELKMSTKDHLQRNIKIEAHGLKGSSSRLIFLKKISRPHSSAKKEKTVGYILAKIPRKFLHELIKDFNPQSGYLEVEQYFSGKSVSMITSGDQSLKSMPLYLFQKLENTQWRFKFWPEKQNDTPPLSFIWLPILLLTLSILVFILLFILVYFIIKNSKKEHYVSVPERQTFTPAETHDEATQSSEVTNVIYNKDHGINIDETATEETEALDSCSKIIFRAYDIRGTTGKCINAPMFKKIAYALASEMNQKKQTRVSVGYDGRNSSPALMKAITDALLESGINVLDIGMVTSPMLYYAAINKTDGNGVMVTASHNPANYNGLKIMINGLTYNGEQLQKLRQIMLSGKRITGKGGQQSQLDIFSEYTNKITNNVILARPLKIVVDSANGVTGKFAQLFFEQLGCKVHVLNDDVDGDFPVHDPDPSRPENMSDLIKQVEEDRADLGIAFDGDGDRIGLVSSAGEIIWPDRILMLLAKDLLSRHKKATILYDVKSSWQLDKFIKDLDGNALMCASGHSLMKSKLAETEAMLAGEMSGHIFIKERWFGFDDAFFVAARLLEILSIDLRKSRQVFAELPDSLNTPEILIATTRSQQIMKKISADLSAFESGKIITIDGLRVEYEDGWGLVRSSNTTDNLTMRFEANDEQALQRIAAIFKDALLAIDDNLDFPF